MFTLNIYDIHYSILVEDFQNFNRKGLHNKGLHSFENIPFHQTGIWKI